MKVYLVGGACRDMLMLEVPHDYDFVVTGATPQYFVDKGFEVVGKDFPVFLEPTHKWEVALARTERKIGVGYTGFTADWHDVTIEEDLGRRDLTINAIAREVDWEETVKYGHPIYAEGSKFIDPFGGIKDLENHVMYPCTEAFKEDPLRVLRVARFAAKYPNFCISQQLWTYMFEAALELTSVSKERIWVETEKALKCKNPVEYFDTLKIVVDKTGINLFKPLFDLEKANLKSLWHNEQNTFVHTLMVLFYATKHFNDPEILWACVCHDLGKLTTFEDNNTYHNHEEVGVPIVDNFCNNYKVPTAFKQLALIATKYHLKVHNVLGRGFDNAMKPKTVMKLFEDTKALNKPEQFHKMLKVCEADAHGRIGFAADQPYLQRVYLEECLDAVLSVDTKTISAKMITEGKNGLAIGEAIRVARIDAIRSINEKWANHRGYN